MLEVEINVMMLKVNVMMQKVAKQAAIGCPESEIVCSVHVDGPYCCEANGGRVWVYGTWPPRDSNMET